jgi:hypothetical protein
MKDPYNYGYLFEQILYEKLKALNMFDEIYYEKDLKERWGWDAASVDYLLVYKNKMIVLQSKWRKTRRRENAHINNFLKSIKHISRLIEGKTLIFGLWVSRREPFQDNIVQLSNHNIFCISDFHSMTKVANQMIDVLKQNLNE